MGTVHEDFAIESVAGDVFLLGNTPWKVRRVESGRVRVEDAQGSSPTLPFWLGEAPGRTRELSDEVSALREELASRQGSGDSVAASDGVASGDGVAWLVDGWGVPASAAEQAVEYIAEGLRVLGGGADEAARGGGAVLRRIGRDADGGTRTLRRGDQPRMGDGAAEADLPRL